MTNSLTPAEWIAAQKLIALALAEDLGAANDITSLATIPESTQGTANLIVRAPGVIAGMEIGGMVSRAVCQELRFQAAISDGSRVERGQSIGKMTGGMRSILAAERTILNFLQHLSGIATLTRQYVDAVSGKSMILDTRKTTPGWRLLEKYAVRCGGGKNHRIGLYDGVLIKDNHLAALGGGPEAVQLAVTAARKAHVSVPVEVEVDSWELFLASLRARPDIILLDNMNVDVMTKCVAQRNVDAPNMQLEASGGVNLQTIVGIAATGVDRISVGALTHSAPALDIALDFQTN